MPGLGSVDPSPTPAMPFIPFDIQKRIIAHALTLSPLYPTREVTDEDFTTRALAGHNGKAVSAKRRSARLVLQKSALSCMAVCKTWKAECTKYLYAEPYLTADNLDSFAQTLRRGDKRWSDLNIHPDSTPGRWVTFIDLSTLHEGHTKLHSTTLVNACRLIFSLVPNLQHLILPSPCPSTALHALVHAPFASRLRSLFGLEVDCDEAMEGETLRQARSIQVLNRLRQVELLGLIGPGAVSPGPSGPEALTTEGMQLSFRLNCLHTLHLQDVQSGMAYRGLANSELPLLSRLYVGSNDHDSPLDPDLRQAFQDAHGHKIMSLYFLPPPLFARLDTQIGHPSLDMYPRLTHLMSAPGMCSVVGDVTASCPSLQFLGIHKVPSDSVQNDPYRTWFANLARSKHASLHLKKMTIDGFRFVKVDLGERAMSTGSSGEMRKWAERMKDVDVDLVDMYGETAPMIHHQPRSPRSSAAPVGTRGRGRRSADCQRPWIQPDALDEDGA